MGLPSGKESTCQCRRPGDGSSIPGSGSFPGGGNGNPLQYSCRGNGQRSLVGYSAWGHKEFDKTEHARMHPYLNSEKIEIRNQAYFSLYRNSRLGGLLCSHSGTYASILYISQSLWPESPHFSQTRARKRECGIFDTSSGLVILESYLHDSLSPYSIHSG